MSNIKKSERQESKLEVFHKMYKVRSEITVLVMNKFYISSTKIQKLINKDERLKENIYEYINLQIQIMSKRLIELSVNITSFLKIAFTINPVNKQELDERRVNLTKAMANCNALQDELQYIAETLYVDINKYTSLVLEIQQVFLLIKKIRQMDNKLKINI